jgi:CTD kinase subunit beta
MESPPAKIRLDDRELEGLHPDRVAMLTGRRSGWNDGVVLDTPAAPRREGGEVWGGFYGDEPIGRTAAPPSPFLVGFDDDQMPVNNRVHQARNTFVLPPTPSHIQPVTEMGAQKRTSDGEVKQPIGPHPSFIRVSAQYQSQQAIDTKLQQAGGDHNERSLAEAKEASLRLQGVQWIDVVRRALQLPVRTYTTAVIYYHKFRLAHPPGTHTGDNYLWNDAAAASLLVACKLEDTLKKSRDILAASFNLKTASAHDHLPSDDPTFEVQSRAVIGLERMVLEASTFDFRSRGPHHMLAKIAKTLGHGEEVKAVYSLAWIALTDLYRTFAPLKQTSVTLALSMMELAARLLSAENVLGAIARYDLTKVETTREETMETMLDSLDLYIQHTAASTLGTQYSLDDFLRLRLALKKECDSNSIPRNCTAPPQASPAQVLPASKVQNGHPTPVSPPQNGTSQVLPAPIRLEHRPPVSGGTLRFMLNPQLAHDERKQVEDLFIEEWEEYEEEIEVPLPRTERRQGPPSSRASSRGGRSDDRRDDRERVPPRSFDDHRREERARVDRERERLYDRDARRPPPPRDSRRYEDSRRYPDDRDRRYDGRPRYDDRRPPRDDRRYPPRDDRDSRR